MNDQATGEGTVGKALEILDQVAEIGQPVRFSRLLASSPYPKATLYRYLQTLVKQGMLKYNEELQTYSMGLRLVSLAHAAWKQSSLAPIARPYVDELAQVTRETIHLAQMDRGQVLYVDKRNAAEPVDMFSQAGKIGPGYCTGVGKVIMAFMDEFDLQEAIRNQSFNRQTPTTLCSAEELETELGVIRSEGFSYDREEHEPGIICIAAPILNERDLAIGALSVTTTTRRKSLHDLKELRPTLSTTAENIAAAARAWRFPTESP